MVRSQVGVIWFRLRVRGIPVHVAHAGSGSNAIMAAYHLIHALQKLEVEWNERAKADRHFKTLTHPINFNPGIIKGGDWASSVPAWCDVDCRIAVLPGWSIADCQKEILACVSAASRDHRFLSNNPPDVEWSGFLSEGYELKDSAAPEAAFGKAFSAVYGGKVEVTWSMTIDATRRTLAFDWVESGGPPVNEPAREGFGSRLLDFVLPGQIQARTRIEYAPQGVRVHCSVPLPAETKN